MVHTVRLATISVLEMLFGITSGESMKNHARMDQIRKRAELDHEIDTERLNVLIVDLDELVASDAGRDAYVRGGAAEVLVMSKHPMVIEVLGELSQSLPEMARRQKTLALISREEYKRGTIARKIDRLATERIGIVMGGSPVPPEMIAQGDDLNEQLRAVNATIALLYELL